MEPKRLTISQAETSKESSVWVLNTSGTKGQSKGIVNITITEGNGRSAVVRIPVTKIPVDMTTQATKQALLSSPDVRRLVQARVITLISEDDAIKLLDSDEAREEQRRLLNIDSMHEVGEDQYSQEVKSVMDEAAGNIGGFAMNIAHTTDGEDAVLANLKNNLESLTQVELQYIVNNSTSHKVKGVAAEHIIR